MIGIRSLDDRTYEELIQKALAEIPLYTKEWTNFNPSDPGITILENLTAFEILQQNHIDRITPAIRRKLLKLVGFQQEKGRCARIFLSPQNLKDRIELPPNQKFWLGDLCFETNKSVRLNPWKIKKIYSICQGEKREFSFLTEREVNIPAHIFGDKPSCEDSIYFLTDGLPAAEEEVIFSFTVADRYNRNPFTDKGKSHFASLRWECYTTEGFKEMKVKDSTDCFLVTGAVKMRMPGEPALYTEGEETGYLIRAALTRADYDVRPKLVSVEGFLFEAWQKQTLSACYTFQKTHDITLQSDLLKEGYMVVFGKEEKGASYHRYDPAQGGGLTGRYCEIEHIQGDRVALSFGRKKFQYAPGKLKAPVKVLLYNEEIMRKYSLGKVMGYDKQRILLPVKNIVPESFSILAARTNEEGEEIYDFVRPGYMDKEALGYYLYEKEGEIEIVNAGAFTGASLFMASCSVTAGEEGNIRKGNYLRAEGLREDIAFYNPEGGTQGKFRETLKEVEERFLKDIHKSYTAVTARDYEELIKHTPELCIHKVRAYMNKERNMVRVAVKPGTDERFPQLSEIYHKAINKQLEDKRLLTTKIVIMNPQYVPIDIHGTIYVNSHYRNSREEIEAAIHRCVDYIDSDKNFGEILRFDDLYRTIQKLDCVEFIYDLHMASQKPGLARMEESDIYPQENCLCHVGNLYLDIGTYGK